MLPVVYVLDSFGNGTHDTAWNAWSGAMANPNKKLGVLHSCYGVDGAFLAPLMATSMMTKAKKG